MIVVKSSIISICVRKNKKVYRCLKREWLSDPVVVYIPVADAIVVDYTTGCSKFLKPVPQEGRNPDFWNKIPLSPVVLPEDNVLIEYDRCNVYRTKVPKGATIITRSFGRPEWAGTVGVILPEPVSG